MPARAMAVAAVLALLAGAWTMQSRARDRIAVAGFWFEPGPFSIGVLDIAHGGGPLVPSELARVEAAAGQELRAAFAGLRLRITDRRDATYGVRVVQELASWSPYRRMLGVAGESRAVRPFGGRGAVSFRVLADNAAVYSLPGNSRGELLLGIGRGIGRAAAHELAHQVLPSTDLHESRDRASYEYLSAGRPEQYYGTLRWERAWPLLVQRLGLVDAVQAR